MPLSFNSYTSRPAHTTPLNGAAVPPALTEMEKDILSFGDSVFEARSAGAGFGATVHALPEGSMYPPGLEATVSYIRHSEGGSIGVIYAGVYARVSVPRDASAPTGDGLVSVSRSDTATRLGDMLIAALPVATSPTAAAAEQAAACTIVGFLADVAAGADDGLAACTESHEVNFGLWAKRALQEGLPSVLQNATALCVRSRPGDNGNRSEHVLTYGFGDPSTSAPEFAERDYDDWRVSQSWQYDDSSPDSP